MAFRLISAVHTFSLHIHQMSPNNSFATEQEADAFFRSKLDQRWLKRPQTPDFYIDYVVEMDKHGEPSGEKFAVQLKGTRSARYVGPELAFKLNTKHLLYFIDKSPEPVFLVVVDLSAQKGYWIFVQHCEKEHLSGWRSQKTTTVRIPIANMIGDNDRLRSAAQDAVSYMRELRPGSVGSAVSHLENTLKSLDGRFDVEVSHADAVTHVHLNPKETVDGTLRFKTPEARRKFEDLRATGKPMDFKPDEIQFHGSPIFSKLLERAGPGGMSLQSAQRLVCSCSVFERRTPQEEIIVVPQIPGMMIAGTRQARLEASPTGTRTSSSSRNT